jgi:CRP-like cAMP-binding protein
MNKGKNSPDDTAAVLQRTDLFKELSNAEREQVSKVVKWKSYRKETEVIPHMGQDEDVYIIACGRVTVTIFSFDGKEISYQELGPGETFGELSAIDQLPRTANVITLEASQIGTLNRKDYWRLINLYPSVAAATLKRLAGLVRFLVDRVYQYGALDVNSRIRMEILRLAEENRLEEGMVSIQNFPTHKEIASRVNTHREAVTRELNDLSRLGIIKQNKRVLTVVDLSKLTELLPEVH